MIARFSLRNNLAWVAVRQYSQAASQGSSSSSSPSPPVSSSASIHDVNVPGLSEACIHPASQPVGPGVDPKKEGAYKVPEYFCYDNMTYFEAEIEMAKYRNPQPSALKTRN